MMTMHAAIDEFILDVCAGKRNQTPESYRKKLNFLARFLRDDCDITQLTPADLERFRRECLERGTKRHGTKTVEGPLSIFTVRSVLRTVIHFFKWLHQTGGLPENIAVNLRLPKEPQPKPKAVHPDTIKKLVQAAARMGEVWERARNLAILYCLTDTGGRLGAFVNATIDGLDFERRTLTVTDKGGKQQVLQLLPVTCTLLKQWLDYRAKLNPVDNHLFVSVHKTKGQGMTASAFYNMLHRLARETDLQGARFNPHSFRHAFARDTLQRGHCDISRLSRLMGHTTPTITLKYYALWDDHELKEAHDMTSPALALGEPPAIQ